MTSTAYSRGWKLEFINNVWVYEDTKLPYIDNRPCKKCGKFFSNDNYEGDKCNKC